MEEVISKKLCTSCVCDRNNCKLIEKYKRGSCIIYRCLNYKLDVNKIHPYKKFEYSIRSNNDKIKNKTLARSK